MRVGNFIDFQLNSYQFEAHVGNSMVSFSGVLEMNDLLLWIKRLLMILCDRMQQFIYEFCQLLSIASTSVNWTICDAPEVKTLYFSQLLVLISANAISLGSNVWNPNSNVLSQTIVSLAAIFQTFLLQPVFTKRYTFNWIIRYSYRYW